jgi:DNA-binding MarR family transcriptional regulator
MNETDPGAAFTELLLEVFRLNGVLLAEGDRLTADLGLTSSRWQVMGAISVHPLSVPYIAREMGLTRQGVQKMVNILVTEGLVEYEDNPHHKSSKLVSLSAEGRSRLSRIDDIQRAWANEIAKDQDVEDLKRTFRFIRQLRDTLERKQS